MCESNSRSCNELGISVGMGEACGFKDRKSGKLFLERASAAVF